MPTPRSREIEGAALGNGHPYVEDFARILNDTAARSGQILDLSER